MKDRARIALAPTQRLALTPGLVAALRILATDAAGLTRYLQDEARDNPALELSAPPPPADWLPRWRQAFDRAAGLAGPGVEGVEGPGPSLMAHVGARLGALGLAPAEARIAEALAEALEPTGWLGRPLAEIAAVTGAPLPEVERVLARVQRIDPPGLFARSLAECLTLQAAEAEVLDAPMRAILANLSLIAAGDPERAARRLGLAEGVLRARLATIRTFDPKPGARFAAFSAPAREPDLVAERTADGGWQVALNRSALPTLRLAAAGDEAARARARALIRAVEGRNATLLRVGAIVLDRQRAALAHGTEALAPMTMEEVAEAAGIALSTVSRVVAGATVDTPCGTWWLRQMFSAARGAGGASAAGLKARLARLVAEEDPAAPLDDAALAAALGEAAGSALARRTVAKYRAGLGIPPAGQRRRAGGAAPMSAPSRTGRPRRGGQAPVAH